MSQPTLLTADAAAALRPAATPSNDLFAADYVQAIARLIRWHAAHDGTELRVRVPPLLVRRVSSLLGEAGYVVTTLKTTHPTGRMIIAWPSSPRTARGPADIGPEMAYERADDSEFVHRWRAFLASLRFRTGGLFVDVLPASLLLERARELVADQGARRKPLTNPDSRPGPVRGRD